MKYLIYIPVFLLFSCGSNEETVNETSENTEAEETQNLETTPEIIDSVIQVEPTLAGPYRENYPSGKLKIEGKTNAKGNRDGLWISYYEDGTKWSESYYDDGNKEGHSLAFFPNGQIRYVGEYKNDKKIGVWKFYAEDGELITEETFE
ncbi:MAG: hypothetical protein ABJG68_08400 [Crocinitomicaceae bacterium]